VFSCKVRDCHEALTVGVATEGDDILMFWIKNFEVTVDEDVFMLSTKFETPFPVRENRFRIRDLSCSIDIGVVVVDTHPWFDMRLAESGMWCGVPLHRSSGMIASLELKQRACIVQLAMVVGILRLGP
jgi:hypothetical protein